MVYHPKIGFHGKTNYDLELISGVTFSPDNGDVDSFLSMESMYAESFDGIQRTDYGARFSSVALLSISFTRVDGEHIPILKVREVLRWLTGSKEVAWMDLFNEGGVIACSYLGRFIDVKLHKIDAKVYGIVAQFESVSPWAYSGIQTKNLNISYSARFQIDNQSDDLFSYVYPKMIFKNSNNDAKLSITNVTTGDVTTFEHLQQGEVVTMENNFVVYSDNTARIFNDDFNFEFPRLIAGINEYLVTGTGALTINYRYPMKVADALAMIDDDNTKPVKTETSVTARGVLILENSGMGCPFNELDAEVINGELIIKKDMDNIDIAQ